MDGNKNTGWPAGPARVLDEQHLHAAGEAEWCNEGVLHKRGIPRGGQEGGRTRRRANRTWHNSGRALRLHSVWLGQEPNRAHTELANFDDCGPAEWENSSRDTGGTEESSRSGCREAETGRSVRSGAKRPDWIALRLHERRTADTPGRLQQHLSNRPRSGIRDDSRGDAP